MKDLTVSIVQSSIEWLDPAANRQRFSQLMAKAVERSDLLLLPEMFTTGFTPEAATLAEPMDGPTADWLREQAQLLNATVAGSVAIADAGQVFNRLLWASPDGQIQSYDKRHLFSFTGEDKIYTAGQQRVIFGCQGWRCCPQICYDLRFPVWSRNCQDYDLLFYVANWPKARINHWSSLLVARAIENLSYTVGVNRTGEDGNGYAHNGQSVVLDPKGKPIMEPGSRPGVYTATLDAEALQRYRKKFGALQDADDFSLMR